ncbi:MAG: hypothetical protein ABIE07_09830 [Candidatus Zixiibacteriota bacterium]
MYNHAKKKWWMPVLCLFFLFQSAFADDKTFKVSSYIPEKFIDFEWRLNGGFNLSGFNTSTDNSFIDEWGNRNYRNSSGDKQSLTLGSSIFYRNETAQRFYIASGDLSVRINNGNSSRDDFSSGNIGEINNSRYESGQAIYTVSIQPSISAGQYLLSDFFVTGAMRFGSSFDIRPENSGTSYNYNKKYLYDSDTDYWMRETNISQSQRSNERSHKINMSAGPGWGRIYSGQFAATAMYIIDELKHHDLLEREPTRDEMLYLTDIIYSYRNTRPIDSRIHKIEALSKIIEYLNNAGVIDYSDRYGYLLIQDIWDYYPRDVRDFGYRASLDAGLDYFYRSNDESEYGDRYSLYTRHLADSLMVDTISIYSGGHDRFYRRRDESKYPYFSLRFQYLKPVSLRWQYDIFTNAIYYLSYKQVSQTYSSDFIEQNHAYTENQYKRFANYQIHANGIVKYIIDSRTTAKAAVNYTFRHYNSETKSLRIIDDNLVQESQTISGVASGSFSLSGTMEYRVSIPTTLLANIGYNISEDNSRSNIYGDNHSSGYSLSLLLSHYLY